MRLWAASRGKIFIGGSFGRAEEFCGDLDVLIIGDIERARQLAQTCGGRSTVEHDLSVSTTIDGMAVQIWTCQPDETEGASLFVEGPAARNVQLRKRARELGMTLRYDGLHDCSGRLSLTREEIIKRLSS